MLRNNHRGPWLAKYDCDIPIGSILLISFLLTDVLYEDEKELSLDLVKCLNREIRALSEAECVYIQVDEPLIAKKPEKALEYGIEHLKMCFEVKCLYTTKDDIECNKAL